MSGPTLIFDHLDTALGKALAGGWSDRGGCTVDASAGGGLDPVLAGLASHGVVPHGVVLTEPRLDEAALMERVDTAPDAVVALADALHRRTVDFLADCRVTIHALMAVGKGSVLALGIDDIAAKILGLPQTPIANQARAAALKSLAKEYARMGLSFNLAICHPPREMAEQAVWQANRERLKVYALRYRPIEMSRYVRFLLSMLEPGIPANGAVIHLGNGVMESAA